MVLINLKNYLRQNNCEIDPNSAEGEKIFDLLNNFKRFSGGPLESRSQMMSDLGGLFGKENLTRRWFNDTRRFN